MTEKNEWQMPKDIKRKAFTPFPIECFPETLKNYTLELAEELQVSIDMVASSILGVLSLCNQGKYYVQGKEGWKEPINLYILVIAPPAERKSAIFSRLTHIIYEYEKNKNLELKPIIISNNDKRDILIGSIEEIKKKLKRDNKNRYELLGELESKQNELLNLEEINYIQLIADDITPEALVKLMKDNNGKMAIFSSEGGIFSTINGRYNNNIPNIDILLKSHSRDKVRVNRKQNDNETDILDNPTLTMLIFAQPLVLENLFKNVEFSAKGLCARFVYCYPESRIGSRNIESKSVNSNTQESYNFLIEKLLDNNDTKILTLSLEAYKVSIEFAQQLEPKLNNELYDMSDWAGKFHGLILRIAGNLHVANNIDTNNSIIDKDTMEKAIKIGNYYLEQAQDVYSIVGTNLEQIKANRILKILKRKRISKTIKRHSLFREVRGTGINKIEDIEGPLNYLKELGYIKEFENENYSGVGKKPDNIIELNPLYFN